MSYKVKNEPNERIDGIARNCMKISKIFVADKDMLWQGIDSLCTQVERIFKDIHDH